MKTRKHQCRIQLAASEPVAYRLVVVVIAVISLLFHCIFNLIHLFGYPSRKCVIKSVFNYKLVDYRYCVPVWMCTQSEIDQYLEALHSAGCDLSAVQYVRRWM